MASKSVLKRLKTFSGSIGKVNQDIWKEMYDRLGRAKHYLKIFGYGIRRFNMPVCYTGQERKTFSNNREK